MRLASWNVNGLRARLEFAGHWLRERQPDVVGLQELKLTDAQFPYEVFEKEGYSALVHGQKSWNGVAVVSRQPAVVRQQGLPGQEEMGARLVTAEVGELSFTTVYVPNGKSVDHADFPRKLAWLDALAAWAEETLAPDRPAVLCGDFNVVPAAIDSWDESGHAGAIFHTEAERERFQRLLDWGFVDVFRARYPELQAFSWWDYRGGAFHRRQGLRIDVLLATRPLAERVRDAGIDRDWRKKVEGLTPSDHAPVWIDV